MSKNLVAVATYNEMENLPELVRMIRKALPDADILVVDDGSPDGTGLWASERAREDSLAPAGRARLFLIERGAKKGLGTAVLDAFRFAVDRGYDHLINLDADFSHPPETLPRLLETAEKENIDVVIGSRYVRGGKIVGWPFRRKVMSRGINLLARLALGLPTKDNSGAMRCYRVDTLRRLDLSRVRSRGYSFFEEILFRLKQVGASFREIPITFTDRVRGKSKINKREACRAIMMLIRIGGEFAARGGNQKTG
ncbi:MAG: polyprenol monophosphomannose synthase [Thermoguttaceae bacterium]|nr:polyprenol monophosphomannose synthase [Thermoguttaceae bacterium]